MNNQDAMTHSTRPSGALCRFSHAAAVLNDQVVISHGFFYDVEARASQWLSDTWSMSTLSPYTWRKVHSRCHTPSATLPACA